MMHDSAPVFAAILAAGSSCRMGRDKLSLSFGGKSSVELSIEAFSACPINIEGIIVATSAANTEAVKALCSHYERVHVIAGGASRGESAHNCVREALRLSAGRKAVIAIHDAARCLVDSGTICRAVEAAFAHGSGIAAIPARDTLRRADGQSVERDGLLVMQTPQCFDLDSIAAAYDKSRADGYPDTDDCAVYMRCIGAPHYSEGSIMNQKLTYAADIPFFTAARGGTMRIGCGEDTHILTENRKLILGGVDIPYEKGLLGHSNADVLLHAVTDALLGAAALGDIGRHFPDTDERYRGISSLTLLSAAYEKIRSAGYAVGNIDATIIAQRPKLAPYIDAMRANIAAALGVSTAAVSVKATTTEGMNAEGRGECISARAVACLRSEVG